MSLDANKAVVARLFEDVLNAGNLDAIDALFAAEHVHHLGARQMTGPAGARALFAGMRAALPDLQATIDEMVAEGDRVAVRFTIRGTHRGTLIGIPATGKQVAYTGADFFRLAAGKIVERRGEVDLLGLQQQLTT